MSLLTANWYIDIFLVSAFIFIAAKLYFKKKFAYWTKLGVQQPWSPAFIFGHFKGISTKKSMSMIIADIYKTNPDEKVVGAYFFTSPIIIVRDLDLMKDIMIRDFSNFHDRGLEIDFELEPLAGSLFSMTGQHWRNLRVKMTPIFTTGKMRMMFSTLIDVGKKLELVLKDASHLPEIEIKEVLARYTTDVIASCAFGIETNALNNADDEFRKMGREITRPTLMQMLLNFIVFAFPSMAKILPFHLIPKKVTDFFIGTVRDTMKYREDNNIYRKDILQLLLELKTLGYVKDVDNPSQMGETPENAQKFTVEQAAAQSFLFFVAGFETTSGTVQYALYELALNPHLQSEVQNEIDGIRKKHNDQINYDGIQEMELLDRVVSETLRKYSVTGSLMRANNEEYKIPDTDITLPPNSKLWFPIYGYHMDEKYFPNPEKFDPNRFLPEVKASRHPFAYIPFGEGPRHCIGNRFALMQTKVALAIVLSQFNVAPSKRTPIPIVFDPKSEFLMPKGLMYLKISKRNK